MGRPSIGLALGDGGARGWAHIGVMRTLSRAGIEPDIICGTSVGALVGGLHLAGKLDALEDWARNLNKMRILSYPGELEHGLGSWLRSVFASEVDSPSILGVMVQSLNILLDRITRSRLAGEPPDVSIAPRLGHIGLLEFDRAQEVIAKGALATERALDELSEAISVVGESGGPWR